MRAVLHQDLIALARCLLLVESNAQRVFARRKIRMAHLADVYRIKHGVSHPKLGDGTLSSALSGCERGEEMPVDRPQYSQALQTSLSEVQRFRALHPVAHETQRGAAGSIASRAPGRASPQSVQ